MKYIGLNLSRIKVLCIFDTNKI